MFADPGALPISFVLDGVPVRGIPASWHPTSRRRTIDANIVETLFEGTHAESNLQVRVEYSVYRDYPVVEWVAWLTNVGTQPTPMISDIQAMDAMFSGAAPVLHHGTGDPCTEASFTTHHTVLGPDDTLEFAPIGGRPCDGASPYYRVVFDGCGFSLAVGWPGQWASAFSGRADGVEIRAGQEKTNLRLLPGESIRTPRMTALSWNGDASRAVNLWRRWYRAHVLPRPRGRPLRPLLACLGTDEGVEFIGATEQNQLSFIEKAKRHGLDFDVWWIDAGWYPCYNAELERRDWHVTGTWGPDPDRFPNGMKSISDAAAKHGGELLLWFEPERVRAGTWIETEHPEWLLSIPDSDGLLNLGDPECRQWLTDHVCQLIEEHGFTIYRQDFNFIVALDAWRGNDADDRQGITENLHVQGYLQFWDDLLARNPGLWLDSCASGGRRNDLETMRRSVPLHYTDFGYGDLPIKLAFHRTMFEWIPYFKDCTVAWDIGGRTRFDHDVDRFAYHCGMAAMLMLTMDLRRDDYDFALAAELVAIWRKAAPFMLNGDFYAHTPDHRDPAQWAAWQFDCPDTGCGFLQAFRLPQAPQESIKVRPFAIDPVATYILTDPEASRTMHVAGAALIDDGFCFDLPERSAAIWFYAKQIGEHVNGV